MSRQYGKHTSSGHKFSQIPSANIQRSTFDRSHGHKLSMAFAGRLVPVMVDEILPGDTMNCRAHIFARQATPFQPLLDNLRLTSFSFFTPSRLVWSNFEKFMGAQEDPDSSTDFTIPQVVMDSNESNKLHSNYDHMGIPPDCAQKSINALPFRCINLIWNSWFRAQDLQDSEVVDLDDGPDAQLDYNPTLRRGKRHDYFTGALPFTQKTPAHLNAPLALSGQFPVTGVGDLRPTFDVSSNIVDSRVESLQTTGNVFLEAGAPTNDATWEWNDPHLEVDFDSGSGSFNTINQLRMAFQMQRLFERDARGGTRLTEVIKAHFGVDSPDMRLNRPEFLGGGTQVINTTPVPVSSDAASGIVGELGAYATSSGSNHSWSKSFTEHGYVITFICVDADLTYQRGVDRMFTRLTKHDFFWPALANTGEQIIRNDEIHATGLGDPDASPPTGDFATFGFTPRYEEYRQKVSRTSGFMRSSAAIPLDVWHLAEDFGDTLPVLGNTFIRSAPPVSRVSAITTEGHFLIDIQFEYKCTRPMPTFGVPGMIDHF